LAGNTLGINHPVDWARQVIGYEPWERQCEVLDALHTHSRVSVRSGHGVGKSDIAALFVCYFVAEHKECVVITTAPTNRQVEKILWPKIRTFWRKTPFARAFPNSITPKAPSLFLTDTRWAIGLSTNEPDRFQGYHSPHLLFIADEASGIPPEIFEASRGILTGENTTELLIGNPTEPSGTFYETHQPGSSYHRIHIGCKESPNVQAGKEVIPGLVTQKWIDEQARDWGEDSPAFKSRVLGQFPDQGEFSLIARSWVEAAIEREADSAARPLRMGVDVARYGSDKTAFVIVNDSGVVYRESHQGWSTMQTAGRTIAIAREWGIDAANVALDDTGVGGGVTDRLDEQDFYARPVNFAERAEDSEKYANIRTEMYAKLGNALRPGDGGAFALPQDARDLARQMTDLQYKFTSRGQMALEKKDDIKKRIGRSPDEADALALTFTLISEAPGAILL